MTTVLRTRTVLVIGRSAVSPAIEGFDMNGHHALLVMTLGWPITPAQQASVSQAIDRSLDLGLPMEAVLVPDVRDALTQLRSDDEVHLFGRRREATALRRRFFAAGLVPAVHRS